MPVTLLDEPSVWGRKHRALWGLGSHLWVLNKEVRENVVLFIDL